MTSVCGGSWEDGKAVCSLRERTPDRLYGQSFAPQDEAAICAEPAERSRRDRRRQAACPCLHGLSQGRQSHPRRLAASSDRFACGIPPRGEGRLRRSRSDRPGSGRRLPGRSNFPARIPSGITSRRGRRLEACQLIHGPRRRLGRSGRRRSGTSPPRALPVPPGPRVHLLQA